jgi:uncharacterized protein
MLAKLFYALVPLMVLLLATVLACFMGYFLMLGLDGQIPLRKLISKSTQFFLVLSIFPMMAYLQINREQLGFAPRKIFFKQLRQGFLIGFITLMPVFILLTILGVNVVDHSESWTIAYLVEKILLGLALALLISLIEEPLFRGILITGLARKVSTLVAIFMSSFYYAILHFLDSKTLIPMNELTIWSGFNLLGEAFGNLLNPAILPAFWALFMVGLFLAMLRTRVKASLGLCIGCHTCWVWQIKLNKSLFNTDFNSDYAYLVSHYDGVIGPLVTAWLMLAILVYRYLDRIRTDLLASETIS